MAASNVEKLLASLVSTIQPLEDALQQLRTERSIDTAVGAQLDIIGSLAGQPRLGMVDSDYRRFIRARIATNNSDGVVEDIITVSDLVVYDDAATYVVAREGVATLRVRVDGVTVTDALGAVLYGFLFGAKSGGVRIVAQWAQSAAANVFQFDDGPGLNQGYLASSMG